MATGERANEADAVYPRLQRKKPGGGDQGPMSGLHGMRRRDHPGVRGRRVPALEISAVSEGRKKPARGTARSRSHMNMQGINDGGVFLVREFFWKPLWTGGCTRECGFHPGAAWVDLLGLANDRDSELDVRGIKIPIKRGQVGWSQFKLAQRWGWSRTKVKAFLKRLEKDGRITVKTDNETTIITLTNYCEYQDAALERMQEKARARAALDPQKHTGSAAEEQQKSSRKALNGGTGEQGKEKEEGDLTPTFEHACGFFEGNAQGYTRDEIREAWSHFEATRHPEGWWMKERARVVQWPPAMESRMLTGRKLTAGKNTAAAATAERQWPAEWGEYDAEKIRGIATGAAASEDGETVKKCRAWLAAHKEF